MKAWDEPPFGDGPGRPDARAIEDLQRQGIDLDPAPGGTHRHGATEHPSDHAHPHVHSEPGQPPVVGIVGAGAVGTALGVALSRAGWPVAAVASRDEARRERFRSLVPGARGFG
ncbi:MAG TPA: 2-dehydropantoate 2-reductase N-terminal domain-containing protein, partial [Candidatus Limnocylindrales bacterium]